MQQYKNRDNTKRVCVRALCIHEGNILVVKRNNYGEEYMIFPGGGIDNGESNFVAAERELFEETTVIGKAIKLVATFPAINGESEQRLILCNYLSGKPLLDPDSEEAKRTDDGKNTYEPLWINIEEWMSSPLVRSGWKDAVSKVQ